MVSRWASPQFLDDPEFKHPGHLVSGNKFRSISNTLPTSFHSFLAHLKLFLDTVLSYPTWPLLGCKHWKPGFELRWGDGNCWCSSASEHIPLVGPEQGWWEKGSPRHGKAHGPVTKAPFIKGVVIIRRTCFLNCMNGLGYEWKMKEVY